MKYLLLAFGVFNSTFLHAQFAFYASGGGNYSHLRVTRNPGGIMEGKGGVGWQTAAGAEYNTHFGYFVYFEAGFSGQTFKKTPLPQEILKASNRITLINPSFSIFLLASATNLILQKNWVYGFMVE
jgi:hypothetical protein